jgi:hypothetical protein
MARSFLVVAAGILCALVCSDSTAYADEPVTVDVAPRQLAVGLTCQTAKSVVVSPGFASLSSDERDQALIMMANCATAEHNQEHPDDPQTVVVGADPNSGGDKIFFKTISLKTAQEVRDACRVVGQATFAFLNATTNVAPPVKVVVGVAGAATNQGGVQCDAFMDGLQHNNPMVVFAPQIISGAAITVKILSMIGAKAPAAAIQNEVNKIGQQAGNTLAHGVQEIKDHPLILLAGPAAVIAAPIAPKVHVSCKLQVKCEWHGLKSSCHNMC